MITPAASPIPTISPQKTPHERYGNPCADTGSNGKDSFWSFFSLGVAARKVDTNATLVSLEFQD